MKAFIVLLVFGAAFARIEEWDWLNGKIAERQIQDPAFRPGREYHYFYNGQLTTGIPGSSKQHSANRIQCIVTVAFRSQNHVLLKLEHVRMGKMNRQIPNPRKIMPFDAFEETPIEQNLKQRLETPCKFSYNGGLVRDIEFDHRDDPWTANVKRSILNLLQINLQQHRRTDTADDARMINIRGAQNEEDGQPMFYRVMEETLEGECETLYTIQQHPTHRSSNSPVLNVTKSINFEKCKKRPQVKYNFRFFEKCPTCDPKYDDDEKFLKSSTVVQYNITGDKQNFLIDSARTESQYVFAPFNEQANVIITYINQTLVLVKTGPIQSIQEPQSPIKSDTEMVFNFEWFVGHEKSMMNGQQQRNSNYLPPNKVESVKKLLQKTLNQMKEQVDEEVTRQFSHLVQWMRVCDHQELEQVVRMQEPGTLSPEEEKKAKNVIPQALGACATKDCVKLLTQKIRQGQISTARGALALKGLLHSQAVSKEIISEITQLCESEKCRESEPLKQSCWLVAGSLMNALCAENEDQLALEAKEDAKKYCDRSQKDTYVRLLFDKLRQSNKWQDKVLMLKAIGNAGLDLSVFELEKIIRQQDSVKHPMYLRSEAIFALRELRNDMPKKIQRILMPVALNRREYPTVRSIATYMLMKTLPERALLDQLARSLINEPSRQFASFLYTQLNAYANSTNPCEQKFATDAKLALRQAKKVSSGLGYSTLAHLSFHNEEQKIGLDLDMGAIYSNVSSIPRHMGAALHLNRLGYLQPYLASVSLFNEGLEPIMRDFYNERGYFSWRQSSSPRNFNSIRQMMDPIQTQRHPRNTQTGENEYERELDDIFSRHLRIQHRNYGNEYDNEPKAYFTAMYKSHTVGVLPLGQEIVQQLMQEAQTNGVEFMQKLQRGLPVDYATVAQLHDLQMLLPTTLGFPLIITVQAPLAVSIKGKIQANFEQSRSALKIQTELKPSAVATVSCKVEAWSPITVTGVKVQSKAKLFTPIDAKLEVEWGQNPQIKAVIKPPTQKRDLLVLESRPITFTQSWLEYIRNPENDNTRDEQTIVGEELNRVNTFNKCYGRSTLGIDVCVRGQVQNTCPMSPKGISSFPPFAGQNKVVVSLQPSDSNQDIQIRINGNVQQLNGQDIHRPKFEFFGRSQPFQSSPGQNSESTEEQSEELDTKPPPYASQNQRQFQQRQQQQQQRQQQIQNTFQKFREYQIKSGYKTQVNVELQASNSRVSWELNHLYDAKERYGKVEMKLHRQQPEQWQACLDAEMMFPERPQFIKDVKEKKIVAHAQMRWGQTCNSQNFVQITTQAERSRQQAEWEREFSEYKQYNARQQCSSNQAWCSPLTQEDFVEKIGHMLKYRVEIDYQNVPVHVQNVTNKLYRALKHQYFWQTDVNQIAVQNPDNKIRAELVLDAQSKQRLNVTIKTPKESVMIQDLPLSQPIFTLNQKQSFADQLHGYVNGLDEDDDLAECSITGKTGWQRRSQVETFDGTKFSAPFASCWVVLAKDCGSPKPEFVVMAKKSDQTGANADLKQVKIITRSKRIELTPDSDEYGSVKCKVNGRPYDPIDDPDVVEHDHTVAQIDKEGSAVSVKLPEAGVVVEFDGYAIKVKLSHYYQGQQCGLCGHFDLESADEFRKPDFTEEQDLRQYYMSYVIQDGTCQAPAQLNDVCETENCDHQKSGSSSSSSSSDEDDNDNDDTTEKPDLKTKVIELDDEICLSTVPVHQCDDDSYGMEITQKQITYCCIDQDNESAEQLERMARYSRKTAIPFNERQRTCAQRITRTESIPGKCKKYKN